jgi:hypothetical protein
MRRSGEKLGQGREKVKAYFEENPAVMAELEAVVRDKMLKVPLEPAVDGVLEEEVVALDAAEEAALLEGNEAAAGSLNKAQ